MLYDWHNIIWVQYKVPKSIFHNQFIDINTYYIKRQCTHFMSIPVNFLKLNYCVFEQEW